MRPADILKGIYNEKPGARPGIFDADLSHPHRKPSIASRARAMDEGPNLSLAVLAAIEREREDVISRGHALHDLLFGFDLPRLFQGSPGSTIPKPANLKLQLQMYSSALFDLEARRYPRLARSESELKSWLTGLSARIAKEVVTQISNNSHSHDFHCSAIDSRRRRSGSGKHRQHSRAGHRGDRGARVYSLRLCPARQRDRGGRGSDVPGRRALRSRCRARRRSLYHVELSRWGRTSRSLPSPPTAAASAHGP